MDFMRFNHRAFWFAGVLVCTPMWFGLLSGQQDRPGLPPVPLPDGPRIYETAEHPQVRVVIVTRELSHPWAVAFLSERHLLVTERGGQLREIVDGRLLPEPVLGVPDVHAVGVAGLMDIALHPRYSDNQFVYLTYTKPGVPGPRVALARGRFSQHRLTDVRDIFLSDVLEDGGAAASRVVFGTDGMLYMTVGGAFGVDSGGPRAQDPNDTVGKIVRLRDDGSVPEDNPFVGQSGHRPELYSLGHRNQLGLTVHPDTGEIWEHENGPLGGDEINLIRAGANYGWPIVSYSRQYSGPRVSTRPWQEGMAQPEIVWLPSIAPSGMTFYSGDRFPNWNGSLFVGALRTGGIRNTGHLERLVFNEAGEERWREWLLGDLRQRIRDVRQGPDGLLYVLTDADEAALLKLEPVD